MTQSTASPGSPKVSKFVAKAGFVIPKKKLSASLIRVFNDEASASAEESVNKVQRKTKWGPDLTQDAAVRKGRALAYQKSEVLEFEKREVIGEILMLNPSYKAPADYKALLKEAKAPIPVK